MPTKRHRRGRGHVRARRGDGWPEFLASAAASKAMSSFQNEALTGLSGCRAGFRRGRIESKGRRCGVSVCREMGGGLR